MPHSRTRPPKAIGSVWVSSIASRVPCSRVSHRTRIRSKINPRASAGEQLSSLGSSLVAKHVRRYPEQPRPCALMAGVEGRSSLERDSEGLLGKILSQNRSEPSS